jgi:hypothetical protein
VSATPGAALLNDLSFAAPETWPLHIERRMAEAVADALEELHTRIVHEAQVWVTDTPPRRHIDYDAVLAFIDEAAAPFPR